MATPWQPSPKKLRDDLVVFAVGDIHGSWGLLRELRRFIQAEIDANPGCRYKIVYLGDYIDRGPKSKEALEFLVGQWQQNQVESVFLCGNHDHFLISLLELPDRGDQSQLADTVFTWLANGGAEAVRSFNVTLQDDCLRDLRKLRDLIAKSLGPDIREFLKQLQLTHREGDYLFVHAGVHPVIPLEVQNSDEFLWIREPFLNAQGGWDHKFCVVHGHTPACPEVLPHRIGVDTGVYMSQALTAVQLRGDQLRFLTTARSATSDWQNRLHYGTPAVYVTVGDSRPSLDCYAHETGL
jgi:serine/threonine protein phosphatase 1